MTRAAPRPYLVIASMLALLILALAATPALGAEPRRLKAQERFAHKLVNCLRTGGKVMRDGSCRGYGTGRFSPERPPLAFSRRISRYVAWPWARRTVRANVCGHTLAGSTVDRRFRTVGLKHIDNGENIGCSNGWKPRRMIITMMRWWFDEKAWGGPHWRQIKAVKFKSAGYGVARMPSGRSRLVINFYGQSIP